MTENNSLYTEPEQPKKTEPKQASLPKVEEPNVLNRLKEVIQKKVERQVVRLDVPERPGVSLRISPNITQNQLRNWRKNSGEDTKAGMDSIKFSCYVIGSTTVGVCIDDEEVYDENGYSLNFASSHILEMTEASRPIPEAVRAFFGVDPHLEAAALAILDASGYSDTIDTTDPTTESSAN
jgi:hypothetical protein